jgi:hypothetical protein
LHDHCTCHQLLWENQNDNSAWQLPKNNSTTSYQCSTMIIILSNITWTSRLPNFSNTHTLSTTLLAIYSRANFVALLHM